MALIYVYRRYIDFELDVELLNKNSGDNLKTFVSFLRSKKTNTIISKRVVYICMLLYISICSNR